MEAKPAISPTRLLVLGVYLADRPNAIDHLVAAFSSSIEWNVTQHWTALGTASLSDAVAAVTVHRADGRVPKFTLLNLMLRHVAPDDYAYVLISDDDVLLPPGFVDEYMALVRQYNFALAQPARTHDSFIDHRFVEQLDGLTARRTNFVEIGPMFSMRRDAAQLMLPFDEESPMGWGYDLVWPRVVGDAGLALGIVDATPVAHTLRRPLTEYAWQEADHKRHEYLARRPHVQPEEAFFIFDSYA